MRGKPLLLATCLISVVLLSGCLSLSPEDLAFTSPAVKNFMQDYPNAKITTVFFSSEQSARMLDRISSECGNLYMEAKDYYRVQIDDPDSGLKIAAWINWETKTIECVVKYGIEGIHVISKLGESLGGCIPRAELKCYEGHIYWFDSCGNKQEKEEHCESGCEFGFCKEKEKKTCEEMGGYCAYPLPVVTGSPFCGLSSAGPCETDDDCVVGGCLDQVCSSVHDEPFVTSCEEKDCYDAETFGAVCGCYKGRCRWDVEGAEEVVGETPPACIGAHAKSEYYCPDNGMCCVPLCYDSDHNNIHKKGYAETRYEGGSGKFEDSCCSGTICGLDQGERLLEAYCSLQGEVMRIYYDCEYGCRDGACETEYLEFCSDTDEGYNIYDYGCTRGGREGHCDHCNEDGTLTEYYCEEGDEIPKQDVVECPGILNKCVGGRCPYVAGEIITEEGDYIVKSGSVIEINDVAAKVFIHPNYSGLEDLISLYMEITANDGQTYFLDMGEECRIIYYGQSDNPVSYNLKIKVNSFTENEEDISQSTASITVTAIDETTECRDSDGEDFYVKGICYDLDHPNGIADNCDSDTEAVDFYCYTEVEGLNQGYTHCLARSFECPSGCEDGACI